jgi:hypothetical protein
MAEVVFRKASRYADVTNIKPISSYRDHAAVIKAVKIQDVDTMRASLDRHYDSSSGRPKRIKQER